MFGATLGAGSFFRLLPGALGPLGSLYAHQEAGWAIIPDYLAVFKPASYRWLMPALNNPTKSAR